MKKKHSPAPWNVNPDYGKDNVYRLWDADSNFHDDTSLEVMDANATLIAAAPELLDILVQIDATADSQLAEHIQARRKVIRDAIAKAVG